MNPAEIGHGCCPADGCEVSFVPVPEGRGSAVFKPPPDNLRYIAALLHRDGRHARKRLAVLMAEVCQVTDDEDLGMAGESQIGFDEYAAPAIQ